MPAEDQGMEPSPSLPQCPCLANSPAMQFRLHAGYGFRLGGSDAQNDGILGQVDIAYRSSPLFGPFTLEAGSSLDFFGETEHLAAYLQLNYHLSPRFSLALRGFGGGVKDDRESDSNTPSTNGDTDDLGGIVQGWLMGEYRINPQFSVGAAVGLDWQLYGKSGGDQGTQLGLVNFLNLGYRFSE